jgi:hypothetical protein
MGGNVDNRSYHYVLKTTMGAYEVAPIGIIRNQTLFIL